ncbi:MAG: hypothetical protein ACD_50C00042G0003 [uncultured bacterium]|nr:MAG: hypothetical protein ACD_50C00042G0003 [uncultured bacterium]OGH13717.1 MAG: hypothetical protein A2687_02915 [Candidatus Levybacteria bacterium RIFCSPHIGHO2_01_FULL_38_26]
MGEARGFSPFKSIFLGFTVFIILNLLYIDWLMFFAPKEDVNQQFVPEDSFPANIAEDSSVQNNICPQSCISQIQEATASQKPEAATVSATAPSENVTSIKVKEFFIPLGFGSSTASDWEDIEGLAVYLDSANFEGIKKATFEASVRIPTGNQTSYVRLFNKTDKHPVWFSEVSLTGGTPTLLISEPITFDKGNKLYQVQVKTQLKFLTIIDQARIHITIQ